MPTLSVQSSVRLMLVIAALAAPHVVNGGWFDADTKEILASATPLESDKDANVVILAEETDVEFAADGRRTLEFRRALRIVTREGLDAWSTVQESWAPWYEEKPVIRARVISPDGTAHELDPTTLFERAARDVNDAVFDDQRVVGAPLPSIAVGSIVEMSVIAREIRPCFERGVVARLRIGNFVPVHRVRFRARAPASLPLNVELVGLPGVEPERREADGRVEVTVEANDLPARPLPEPSSPPDTVWVPFIGFSTGASWKDVASAYAAMVDSKLRGANLDAYVKIALHGASTRDAKIEALTQWLHEKVRYTGVEFGADAIVPAAPGETLSRGYGDCKDKSLLLVAILRRAGLDADLALLLTGPDPEVQERLPGLGVFDHAIVRVAGTPPVWIDATDDTARPGVLAPAVEGRRALVIHPDSDALVTIPATVAGENREELTREFFLAERGRARDIETTRAWGLIDREMRASHAVQEPAELRKNIEKAGLDAYKAKVVERIEISNPRDLSKPLTLSLEASGAKLGETYVDGAQVTADIDGLFQRLTNQLPEPSEKKRIADLWIAQPFVLQSELVFHLPQGFTATSLPDDSDRPVGPARFSTRSIKTPDGTVRVQFVVDSGKRRWTEEDVATFRSSRKQISSMTLVFGQTAYASLKEGHYRQALDEYRRLALLHPKEALHLSQIADTLLAAGLGEAAREQAQHAVALDGTSPDAYRSLGWSMMHDELGRQFREGCDLAEAERAYRKVRALDPQDAMSRSNLALLLEYSPSLVHLGAGARLDSAVQEWQSYRVDFDDHSHDGQLLIDLALLGRYDDLKSLLPSATEAPNAPTMELVVAWGTGGARAAITRAQQLPITDLKRREALAAFGNFLMGQHRYADASAVVLAAAQGGPNPVATRSLADWIASIKPASPKEEPPTDPRGTVFAFIRAVLEGAPSDKLSALVSAEGQSDVSAGELSSTVNGAKRKLVKVGMNEGTLIDVLDSVATWSVEGDRLGWRVKTAISAPGQSTKFRMFLVEENGRPRILEAGVPYRAAGHILNLIDRGELDAARRWLDWAAEELAPPTGKDPIACPCFPRLWKKGDSADTQSMRTAAAALAVSTSDAARAVPILEAALSNTPSAAAPLHGLLLAAYAQLERYDQQATLARRALELWPETVFGFENLTDALLELKRWDELDSISQERLSRGDDIWAHRAAHRVSTARGPREGWDAPFRRLLDSPSVEPGDFNNYAWAAVAFGSVTDNDLAHAKRAAADRVSDWYYLNTLAAVYAELGRDAEAREALVAGLDASNSGASKADWYVAGRIAENLDEPAAARRAYSRALTEGESYPTSVSTITRRRLAILDAMKNPTVGKRRSR